MAKGQWFTKSHDNILSKHNIYLKYNHTRKVKLDIQSIADHITGKIIDAVDVVYGEDTLTIWLDDGTSVEMIVDSIYANVPDLDD